MSESTGIGLSARGLRRLEELAATKPHGERLRYLAGCKCLKCRMANSNYETARARARKAGDWNGIVDADPARQHLKKLSRAGVGYKTAADAAGVARSVVAQIRAGNKTRARARTVRKILAVTPQCRADCSIVPARRTWQLIHRLLDEGFTKTYLAGELGRGRALQIRTTHVLARTELDVERLYRRLTT